MNSLRRDILLAVGLIAFLLASVWASVAVTSRTVNQLLREDAASEGESWTRYLATNVKDLEAIVAGADPSTESASFFERAQKVGDVIRYKIYDAKGSLRLSSDELEKPDEASESIAVHNPSAAAVVLKGQTDVEVKDRDASDEDEEGEEHEENPAFYAETYVPVTARGKVIGIVESYVDQTAKRDAFQSKVLGAALSLGALIAAAFGLPAVGFYWRTRQKRQADSRAAFLADHDALTGLVNRSRFMHDLDAAVSIGCSVAVHLIDIDRFKEINDTLGHEAGDEVLDQVARRLRTLSDRRDLLARLGADEFALAQIIRDPDLVEPFADRLVSAMREPFHLKDHDIDSSASVGTALSPVHGDDAEAVMKSADIALSHSKSEGLGGRSVFRPEMDAELQAQRELEGALRRAVANDGFDLHFQPFQRISDGRLTGFEALLRLPRKGATQLSPAVFVPLAERMGLIGPIGDWVIRRACEIAATWPGELTVAVNLSPVQFEDGRLADKVLAALEATGLPAGRLELEITEGLLLSETEGVLRQLADLKALGVRIAMDDFGTGYSSLSYLWKFPFDKLKIDQSFVRGIGGGDDHLTSVIGAIVALGHSLGMTITAEGVETEAQAVFLTEIGCDLLQGFYLGRPMPIENLPARILNDFRAANQESAPSIGLRGALAS